MLEKSIALLKKRGIFWATSLTITTNNFEVTEDGFVVKLVNAGCKLFMLVEYTPAKEGTESWVLTEKQRAELLKKRNLFRSRFSALFVAFPWDEEEIGGWLSTGRGFIHINAEDNVEPCQFIPYSDSNVRNSTLKEALQSKLLKTIRENHEQLAETHGCALWEHREWVQQLTDKKT